MSRRRQEAGPQPLHVLIAETLYAPEEIAGPVAVLVEGAQIRAVWHVRDEEQARERVNEYQQQRKDAQQFPVEMLNLGSWRLAPGLIDLHIHGFHGYDVTEGTTEDMLAMARKLPRTGVTTFFPTIATTGRAETAGQVQRIADAAERQYAFPASEIAGIRLEGPFISHAKKGAQFGPGIRPPDPVELSELVALGRGWIRILDFAPEEDPEGIFLATAVQLGILTCIGHTMATYEQTMCALDGGARHSTHLFNAMPTLDHRLPGAAGALLTDSRATVEIIADGIHLHPAILKLIVGLRGPNDVALITDAVIAAGLPDGQYDFVGRTVTVADGSVRLADGTLAGSALTLDLAVRNMVALARSRLADAIHMATRTPARIAGIANRKGSIAPGMDADLIALDEFGCVRRTWTRGLLAYSDDGE